MGSFTQAMDATQPARTLGENGAPELTAHGVGDARVALFAGLTRNCASLDALWDAAVREANGDAAILADLVVLAFQTRDCRGGKGERALFTKLFCLLIAIAPEAAAATVALVPEYGSWRDLCVLYDALGDASNLRDAARARAEELRNEIVAVFAKRLRADLAGAAKPSLAAKYAPREHKQHQALSGKLAAALFPGDGRRREKYRKAVAKLSRALDVPEIKMCGKRWADLDVAAVPSRCLAKSRKAFLNEALKGGALSKAREATGDRFPDDADRVACREHVREAALATAGKKLKGAQLFPHEIVNRVCRGPSSTLEDDVANAQWRAIEADLRARLEAGDGGPNLGKVVALVDVSGSMGGTPMDVAVALGLLVSTFAAPAFKDRFLTFESEPRWHALDATASPVEKMRAARAAPWGGSTSFAKALDRVLDACVEHKLSPEEIPDLIVFSDMQFDQAEGYGGRDAPWTTWHERFVKKFADAGLRVRGARWDAPAITYWNLRGDTRGGFLAEHDKPGVRLLSGFSPALLKLVLGGEEEEDVVVVNADGTASVVKAKPTPYATLRRALDDGRYDAVRTALAGLESGAFAAYGFAPSVAAMTLDDDFVDVAADR